VVIVGVIFALVFIVIVIVGRSQIDGVQQHSRDMRIDLRQNIARTAQGLFGGVPGTDHEDDRIGPNRPRVLSKPFHLRHLIAEIDALLSQ